MKNRKRKRVLAIGLDAAEPALVRQLIEEGALPTLKRLLEAGSWSRVESPAMIGSGTVWPTFFTGNEPAAHGIYSDWCWQPQGMRLARYDGSHLVPFWKQLANEGLTVGVLDVPFAPLVGLITGFEITEWGAHDAFEGQMNFAPNEIAELVTKKVPPHPFASNERGATAHRDVEGLKKLGAECLAGARLRGEIAELLITERETDLSIIVFPEIHHAAHRLWHTVAADHPLYTGDEFQAARTLSPSPANVLREVDSQIARLIEAVGDDAAVMVFSLHGMRPVRGLPAFLATLLEEAGMSRVDDWSGLSWKGRTQSLIAAIKSRVPQGLKGLYHKNVPQRIAYKLAQPTMIPAYDWNQTRAFALPTDQHGWIRINLAGRESKGSVPPGRYEETCLEIEEALNAVVTEEGRPLVHGVMRTAKTVEEALQGRLPDLVVHWHDAAFELPLRIRGRLLEAHPAASGQTGQHAPEGFCIWKGAATAAPETISATALHHLLVNSLA
jgi:predicted AlkP superfamily phosphohydrolase/phosphomutase